MSWSEMLKKKLIKDIAEALPRRTKVPPCLLIVGPVSYGKSSLVNTFLSAASVDIEEKALTGTDTRSLTSKFTRYDSVGQLPRNYRLCDTMGVLSDVQRGIRPNDVVFALNGNIGQQYEFKEDKDISEDDPKFIKNPPEEFRSHALIIVLDISKVKELPSIFRTALQNAIGKSRSADIPVAIILTKADRFCESVGKDVKNVFSCLHVENIVRYTQELFGIDERNIFPVINYSRQVAKGEEGLKRDIISLFALKRILHLAASYMEGPEYNGTKSTSKTAKSATT